MTQYEIYLFKLGRKIPSEPEKMFVEAKNTNDLRKKLLRKYSVYWNGTRGGIYATFDVYHKKGDALVGRLEFLKYPGWDGPYVWVKPKNFYNGNQDTWEVEPRTGRLIGWREQMKKERRD